MVGSVVLGTSIPREAFQRARDSSSASVCWWVIGVSGDVWREWQKVRGRGEADGEGEGEGEREREKKGGLRERELKVEPT